MSDIPQDGGSAYALSPAAAGGRRRRSGKLRVVTKKVARHHLKKMGMKLRGGGPDPDPAPVVGTDAKKADGTMGGRRRRGRSGKSTRRRKSRGYSLF
jgi:hypothetical protein